MTQRRLYLLLCVLGTVLPLSQFVPWLLAQPLDAGLVSRFFAELFATRIGGFFAFDVIISALALFTFIWFDTRARRVDAAWTAVVATLTVGVSLGLPLFLYLRTGRETGGGPASAASSAIQ
jgi:hypothetical protein